MKIVIKAAITLIAMTGEDRARLAAAAGDDATIVYVDDDEWALAEIEDTDVLFGSIDEPLFARAKRLRWVHAASSGVDFMLFPAFVESPIQLTSEKGLVGSHLADHAFGLLLALTRRVAEAYRDGAMQWDHRVDYRRREIELEGLTMGVVGFGGTGSAIARRAQGFGMRTIATDIAPMDAPPGVEWVRGPEALDDLLEQSDVVTVGLPLTPATRGLFDSARFARMKDGAFFVNVTRGEVVDHPALLGALDAGKLGGAGLDVHYREPLPVDDPLWSHPDVVMTPHTAGASQYRVKRNFARFIDNLRRFRDGEPLDGLIDKTAGF